MGGKAGLQHLKSGWRSLKNGAKSSLAYCLIATLWNALPAQAEAPGQLELGIKDVNAGKKCKLVLASPGDSTAYLYECLPGPRGSEKAPYLLLWDGSYEWLAFEPTANGYRSPPITKVFNGSEALRETPRIRDLPNVVPTKLAQAEGISSLLERPQFKRLTAGSPKLKAVENHFRSESARLKSLYDLPITVTVGPSTNPTKLTCTKSSASNCPFLHCKSPQSTSDFLLRLESPLLDRTYAAPELVEIQGNQIAPPPEVRSIRSGEEDLISSNILNSPSAYDRQQIRNWQAFLPAEKDPLAAEFHKRGELEHIVQRKKDIKSCNVDPIQSLLAGEQAAFARLKKELTSKDLAVSVQWVGGVLEKSIVDRSLLSPRGCDEAQTLLGNSLTLESSKSGAISESEAQEVFNEVLSLGLPFDYPRDGCNAKAHLVCHHLAQKRPPIETEKIWVKGILEPPGVPDLMWQHHVAAVIKVKTANGDVERRVIDPALDPTGPLPYEKWLQLAGAPSALHTGWPLIKQPGISTFGFSPSDIYWEETTTIQDVNGMDYLSRARESIEYINSIKPVKKKDSNLE